MTKILSYIVFHTIEQMLPGMPGHELRKELGKNRTMRKRGKVVTREGSRRRPGPGNPKGGCLVVNL